MSDRLPPMAGHYLYESMSPQDQQYYKPCGFPHGPACQIYIDSRREDTIGWPGYKTVIYGIMPHYWLNYDRHGRVVPYEPEPSPLNFEAMLYV